MLELTRGDLFRAEIGICARCAADDKAINSCCAVGVLHNPYCRAYNRVRKASWEGCDVVFYSHKATHCLRANRKAWAQYSVWLAPLAAVQDGLFQV